MSTVLQNHLNHKNLRIIIGIGKLLAKEDKHLFAEFVTQYADDDLWGKACKKYKTITNNLTTDIFSTWSSENIKPCLPHINFMAATLSPLERRLAMLRFSGDSDLYYLLGKSGAIMEKTPPVTNDEGDFCYSSYKFWKRVEALTHQIGQYIYKTRQKTTAKNNSKGGKIKIAEASHQTDDHDKVILLLINYLKDYLKQGKNYIDMLQKPPELPPTEISGWQRYDPTGAAAVNVLMSEVLGFERHNLYGHYFDFCDILGLNSSYVLMNARYLPAICKNWSADEWATFKHDLILPLNTPGRINPIAVWAPGIIFNTIGWGGSRPTYLNTSACEAMCNHLLEKRELITLFKKISNNIDLTKKLVHALHDGLLIINDDSSNPQSYKFYDHKFGSENAWMYWMEGTVLDGYDSQYFKAHVQEKRLREITGDDKIKKSKIKI